MAQSEAQLEELRCEVEKRQALEARIRATVRVLSVGQLLRTAQYGISSMVVHRAREITPGGLKGDRARTPLGHCMSSYAPPYNIYVSQ
jgi:hypothetical protein